MRFRIFIFLAALFSLALAACSPKKDDLDQDWQLYQNAELGISFELPDTWVTQEAGDVITLAIDQEALDNGILSGAGASITLATPKDFDGYSEPGSILELFVEYFEYGRANLERIGEPELISIQGQPASTISYRGSVREQTGFFTATIISHDDNIALVLTIDGSENEEHQDTLERITHSISIYSPIK